MVTKAATYRIPERTADRLAQAHYRTGKPKATIVAEALEHWLANPRKPGCPLTRAIRHAGELEQTAPERGAA
jgi:hypothetical protein